MTTLFDLALARKIEDAGIIAVLVIDRAEDAVPLAQSLLAGGIGIIELTLRTSASLDALQKIRLEVPEMVVGVGTIVTVEQVSQAVKTNAAFGVSPGCNPLVIAAAREAGLSFAPGVATPSDIEIAIEQGCKLLKFFPAEPSGGLDYLRAIASPYTHLGIRFVPLGGLNAKNMASYLSDPSVVALGGSWIAPRELIKAKQWEQITTIAAEAVQIIKTTREK